MTRGEELPRELLDLRTRVIPGDGVAPLAKILGKLAEKGYAGPISVELFLPQFQQADPFALAQESGGRRRGCCGRRGCSAREKDNPGDRVRSGETGGVPPCGAEASG